MDTSAGVAAATFYAMICLSSRAFTFATKTLLLPHDFLRLMFD